MKEVKIQRQEVVYVGYNDTSNYVYSTFKKTLFNFKGKDFVKNNILNALGEDYLNNFLVVDPKSGKATYNMDAVAKEIILQCKLSGLFDENDVRQSGIFINKNNEIIVNNGKQVWTKKEDKNSVLIDGCLYQSGKETGINRNTDYRLTNFETNKLFKEFEKLNFKNGVQDLYNLIGWVAIAPFAGIDVYNFEDQIRTMMSLSGPAGSGKSTVLKKILRLLGSFGMKFAGSSSEAGIRQKMQKNAFTFVADEFESEGKSSDDIIQMLRIAYSGDEIVRGSADNKNAQVFKLSMNALISGINPPKLSPADASRFITIELLKLESDELNTLEYMLLEDFTGDKAFDFDEFGKRMTRFMIEYYDTFKTIEKVVASYLESRGATKRFSATHRSVMASAFMINNPESIIFRNSHKAEQIDGYTNDCFNYKKETYTEVEMKIYNNFKTKFDFILLKEFLENFKIDEMIEESFSNKDEDNLIDIILSAGVKSGTIGYDSVINHLFCYNNSKKDYKKLLGDFGMKFASNDVEGVCLTIDTLDINFIKLLKGTKFEKSDIKKVITRSPLVEGLNKEESIGNKTRSRRGLIKLNIDTDKYKLD